MLCGPRSRRASRLSLLVSLPLLALVAAGCSTPDSKVADAERTRCTSPGVSDTKIRLGLLLSDSGETRGIWQGMRGGIEARLGVANDQGGVHGREITYTWRDDESNLNMNASAARALVERDNVFALLEGSTVVSGSAQYLADNHVPVAGIAQESVWSANSNMISYANLVPPPNSPTRDTIGRYASAVGGQSAVIMINSQYQASVQGGRQIAESLLGGGVTVVKTLDYSSTNIAPSRLAQRIAETGADVLVGAVPSEDFAEVYAATRQAGIPLAAAISVSGLGQGLVDTYGPRISGASYYTSVIPLDVASPAHQTYLAAMARYAPNQSPGEEKSLEAYITTDLLVTGLEMAGACPTREGLLAALRSLDAYKGAGMLSAPVDLTEGFGRLPACYTFVQVNKAGTGFEVAPHNPICPTT